jgi:hypothetical protein
LLLRWPPDATPIRVILSDYATANRRAGRPLCRDEFAADLMLLLTSEYAARKRLILSPALVLGELQSWNLRQSLTRSYCCRS